MRTLCDLARLDEAQVVAGRRLAENPNSREPGRKHSRAFWHGWRSRRMELSPDDRDEAHCELYFRFWWWVLRHQPDSLRIVAGYAPDSDIAHSSVKVTEMYLDYVDPTTRQRAMRFGGRSA
ncbi:hypothetical protein GBZ48_34610 [Azospirillum melinis]|uniref:Uncharacterized protein n=1 Tax=Azospirillum melinis TaxID=328839 RepID=A0ABX2KL34_9PROT|nr:hypothetical protein [Azospirillum melinis]MBP2309274.1 hypothetical protein [Azospirillum melinis]NUB04338.1 hypothetical protein [Azospirillum melinis]